MTGIAKCKGPTFVSENALIRWRSQTIPLSCRNKTSVQRVATLPGMGSKVQLGNDSLRPLILSSELCLTDIANCALRQNRQSKMPKYQYPVV